MYLISITVSKLLKVFISLLRLGAGYTWTGHLALKLYPDLFSEKKLLPSKALIFISGTNGKTTTTKMLTHVLRNNGYSVATNSSGANLLNGIAAALLLDTDVLGRAKSDIGIFEVDEFTLPLILDKLTPDVLVLLNLSRDQLDRYGETDIILERWVDSVKNLPRSTKLVINSEQKRFNEISYATEATSIEFKNSSSEAVILASAVFGLSKDRVAGSLHDFSPAWGRGESITHKNFSWRVYLAKNPASFDNNLDAISSDTYLFVFNDNIPDGRDVSWIYDISTEKLAKSCKGKNIYVSGKRAFDMAVRLQYAGVLIDPSKVIPDIREAVLFVENGSGSREAVAFPNYSAMLELRKILVGRRIL